ncbi:sialidase family protein [Rhizorhapis suberifaciens]|uniref:Sialidase domain-containing protein n=1 Tax=Rhizorhapis suberifaciens TaxID=13656 RepID=A0A840HXQ0_9SPHN|nr:sialidase family protein [Rhizorhapis suberifaciens]MBB4642377.1 hypothetical protein [Rhizorhapis suberifaciens]
MVAIRPDELPAALSVNPAAAIIVDDGTLVQKATPIQVMDSARALASQEEAEVGAENTKIMSPLRVSQAINQLVPDVDLGSFTTPSITDNSTVKEAFEQLGEANDLLLSDEGAGAIGTADGRPAQTLLDGWRMEASHKSFTTDFSSDSTYIVVQDGSSDTFHRHFGQIVEGMDGRLHLIYRKAPEHANTDGATVWYTYSDDGGQNWSAEIELVAPTSGYDQGGMSMCATPTGRLVVIYDQVPSPLAAGINMQRIYSDDNGATWSAPLLLKTVNFTFARAYGRIKVIPAADGSSHRLAWTPYWQISSTPTYEVPLWISEDDGLTWAASTPITSAVGGYNEAEMVAITADVWFAVARGSGLNLFKTVDAGATWSLVGQPTTSDGVAPSLDKFSHNGRWYLLLGYCDRSLDTQAFKIAPVTDALTTAGAFGAPLVVATDAVNASGYQTTVTKPDGTVYMDGGTGFVWFKEYIGFDYTQVRFGRADLFTLAMESIRGVAVASGVFTVYDTDFEPKLSVTTEGGAGTDQLDTISGGFEGQIIRCESTTSSLDVTFKHGTDNLVLANGRDFTLFTAGAAASHIVLMKMGSNWYELARSVDSTNGFYSEGSFTPIPHGSTVAGSPTGTFVGQYTKIGRRFDYSIQLVFTAIGGMTGNFQCSGIPVAISNGAAYRGGIQVGLRANFTNDFVVGGYHLENSSIIRFQRMDQDNVAVGVADLSATTNLYFSGSFVAST